MKMELRTYYVSSEKGNDQNDGKSELTPFATLEPLQKCELQPGDKILLERGSVFEDQYLHIRQSGMKDAPIEVGAYGEGCLPKIHANGTGKWYQDYGRPLDSPVHVYRGEVSSAILLYDAEYIWLHDLEITNQDSEKELEQYCAPDKMDRTGVAVVAQNRGTLHDIHLSNLMIHDVNGNVYNKHMNNGGIYMTAFQPEDEAKTGVARYDGVLVEDCSVWRVSRWGIAVGYTYQHERFAGAELAEELFTRYGHENVVLRNNYVKEAGGDAITPMYALRSLTEHNSADSCACEMNDHYYRYPGERMGKVAAGIWPWKCKDALFRYNSVRDMKLNQDGMAYDADSGDGTVYEYNYSRQNEGGCVMFCLEEAIHNTFRKNVSEDDLGGILSPSGNPDAYVAENTFLMRRSVPLLRNQMSDGSVTLEKNQIVIIEK